MSRTQEVIRGVVRHVTEADPTHGIPLAFRIEQVDDSGSIKGSVQARLPLLERGAAVVDGDDVEVTGTRGSDGVLDVAQLANLSTGARIRSYPQRAQVASMLLPFVFGGIGFLLGAILGARTPKLGPDPMPGFVSGGFVGGIIGFIAGVVLQILSHVVMRLGRTRS